MGWKKLTLRRMKPTTRKLAKLVMEAESTTRKLAKLVDAIAELEIDSVALHTMESNGRQPLARIESGGRLAHGWPRCPHCREEFPHPAASPEPEPEIDDPAEYFDEVLRLNELRKADPGALAEQTRAKALELRAARADLGHNVTRPGAE